MQCADLQDHLHVQEEVDMQEIIRRLGLHRNHYGVATACGSAHGRRVATEGAHARIRTLRRVRATRTHPQPVDRRQHHAGHDVKGVRAAEWTTRCDEPSRIVVT